VVGETRLTVLIGSFATSHCRTEKQFYSYRAAHLYAVEFVSHLARLSDRFRDSYLEAINKAYSGPTASFFLSSESSRILKLAAKDPSPFYWPELIFKAAENVVHTLRQILIDSNPQTFLHDGSVLKLGKALSCFILFTTCNRYQTDLHILFC
jgi:hypothetical protein